MIRTMLPWHVDVSLRVLEMNSASGTLTDRRDGPDSTLALAL
ncbi:hypothetical protein [Methylobacillus caricis]|nr:hypothetical protein [Methylobacillus caricis]